MAQSSTRNPGGSPKPTRRIGMAHQGDVAACPQRLPGIGRVVGAGDLCRPQKPRKTVKMTERMRRMAASIRNTQSDGRRR